MYVIKRKDDNHGHKFKKLKGRFQPDDCLLTKWECEYCGASGYTVYEGKTVKDTGLISLCGQYYDGSITHCPVGINNHEPVPIFTRMKFKRTKKVKRSKVKQFKRTKK